MKIIEIKRIIKIIFISILLTILLLIIFLKPYIKTSYKGTAICVIAKDENLYIKDFINYYKNLGIKKIFLYDNNEILGENFQEVLKNDIQTNFVEIINVRGKTKIQVKAYNDCYQKNINDFSWFLIIDVDEYLYIKNNISLYQFLNDIKFKNCDNIHINHKMYGDSDLLHYDSRPVFERFWKNYKYMTVVKTFVRGGIKNANMRLHRSFNISRYCNSAGKKVTPKGVRTNDLEIKNAEIRHYITKTIEEFYLKLLKGWPDMKTGTERYFKFIEHRIKYFFQLNRITQRKFEIIYPLIKNKHFIKYLLKQLNSSYKIKKKLL